MTILGILSLGFSKLDVQNIIHIAADGSFYNYKTGLNFYQGNVHVVQGNSNLIADKLIAKNDNQHKLIEAIAYGIKSQAEYNETLKANDTLTAKADVIKFYPKTSSIILEGNVLLTQGENSFHGPLIIYNMKTQTVAAPASNNGRATIIIDPKKLKL